VTPTREGAPSAERDTPDVVGPELDARFREAAAAAGLLDAAYDVVESPLGSLLIATSGRGLCAIRFDPGLDEIDHLARRHGLKVLRVPRRLERTVRQLEEYFEGGRVRFEIDIDVSGIPPFQQRVLAVLARVPFGRTVTYADLAASLGNRLAARAVGAALNKNPIPIVLPCHRVVGATGELVGYAGGLERKRTLLELEGVRFGPEDDDKVAIG
jgi:methylated-DNA-[protein]-cysteine S-methyltransferase